MNYPVWNIPSIGGGLLIALIYSLDQLKVVPQYGPMVMFAVTLVAGISALAWMILKAKEAVSGASEGEER